jgi:hypothetical protein
MLLNGAALENLEVLENTDGRGTALCMVAIKCISSYAAMQKNHT